MIECGFVYVWNLIGLITLRLNYFPDFRSHVNIGNRKRPKKKLGSISSFAVLKHRDGRCHETGLCYEMVGPDNGGQSGSSSGCSCPARSRWPAACLKRTISRGHDSPGHLTVTSRLYLSRAQSGEPFFNAGRAPRFYV
jgi:hypothetical protein